MSLDEVTKDLFSRVTLLMRAHDRLEDERDDLRVEVKALQQTLQHRDRRVNELMEEVSTLREERDAILRAIH